MRKRKLNDRPYYCYCFGEAGEDESAEKEWLAYNQLSLAGVKCEPAKSRKRHSAEKGCLSGR
ncbi:MAG: hypothetical protein K1W27_04930 [Lachnospiraceae bacterium]